MRPGSTRLWWMRTPPRGIYVCPARNVHALTIRDRFGDALDKEIMGVRGGPELAAPAGPGPR